MTDKQIIIDGCEFQSDCIEYKDISYLKIMPICAIHELSIACHDKVNKCKYYKLYKQLKRKEQELQQAMDNYVQLDLQRVKEYNELVDLYKAKEQECERLKWYLKEIRDDELKTLDIELDEYETHCLDTEYSNTINLVEEALEEISPEDCRYKKDK